MGPYKPLLLGWWVYPLWKDGSWSTPAPHDLPPRSWPFGRSSGRSRGRPGDWSTTRPFCRKKRQKKTAKRLEEIRLTTLGCPKKTLQIYNLPGLFFHFPQVSGMVFRISIFNGSYLMVLWTDLYRKNIGQNSWYSSSSQISGRTTHWIETT